MDKSTKDTGNTLHSRDRLIDEIKTLDSAIQNINRDDPDLNCRLARLYNERGHMKYLQVEFVSAVEDFTAALKLDPSLAIAYYNRGLIHYRLAGFKDAIADMEQTLLLDPSFESASACLDQAKKDLAKQQLAQ